MPLSSSNPAYQPANFRSGVSSGKVQSYVRLRLRITIPLSSSQEAIVSPLMAEHGLSVDVRRSSLTTNCQARQVDLELAGAIEPMNRALAYLASLKLVIRGKPNVDGDSWHY